MSELGHHHPPAVAHRVALQPLHARLDRLHRRRHPLAGEHLPHPERTTHSQIRSRVQQVPPHRPVDVVGPPRRVVALPLHRERQPPMRRQPASRRLVEVARPLLAHSRREGRAATRRQLEAPRDPVLPHQRRWKSHAPFAHSSSPPLRREIWKPSSPTPNTASAMITSATIAFAPLFSVASRDRGAADRGLD